MRDRCSPGRLLSIAAALVCFAGPTTGTAAASTGQAVAALRHAPCPAPSHALPFSPPEDLIGQARHGVFRVGPTTRHLKPPVRWNWEPNRSQRARNALASLSWLDGLAIDYRQTGRRSSLRRARDLMLDWMRRQPNGGKHTSPSAWRSKVVGDRARTIGYLVRASQCEGMLGGGKAKVALRSVKAHSKWLLRHRVKSNHDLFDSIGLISTGRDFGFLEHSGKLRQTARRRFGAVYRGRVISREGLWLEQSAGYQFLLDRLLRRFIAIDPHRGKLVKLETRMARAASLLIEPDGAIAQLGDSKLKTPTPDYQQRSARQQGMFVLGRSGLAVVKQPGSYLWVTASFFHRAHKHSDDLSFGLFERGHRIISDTGMYDKDPGPIRDYVTSARAHSTLTVDGNGFTRSSKHAYGSAIKAGGEGDGWYAIEGSNPLLAPQGVNHHRIFLYKPGEALIVVDRVASPSRHTYDRYFQLGPDLDADITSGDSLRLSSAHLRGSLQSTSDEAAEHMHLFRGSPPGPGWTSPGYRDFVPRDTADLRSTGRDATYVTTIGLGGGIDSARATTARSEKTIVSLSGLGGPAGVLKVKRHGAKLTVSAGG